MYKRKLCLKAEVFTLMKRPFASLVFALLLVGSPVWGQESPPSAVRQSEILEQASQKLGELSLREDQAQALMGLLLRHLPKIMDENADPFALAKALQPEAEQILDTNQRSMLRAMEREYQSSPISTMSREERRRLIQGGLERLSHPDTSEWLKRIDSFDI